MAYRKEVLAHRKEDIVCVIATRPNFVKMAPVIRELTRAGLAPFVVHTGQHYQEMSDIFLKELEIPLPDCNLHVGSGSHAEQTAAVMVGIEKLCLSIQPRLVIVAGDVNSTLAAGLAAAKLKIPLAHLESGLRSQDRQMPEEINRIVTDHIADLLFVTEESGFRNLKAENIADEKIFFVGNTMIDSLRTYESLAVARKPWVPLGLEEFSYALMTLHRPSNVDSATSIFSLLEAIDAASTMPVLFPVHPRTQKQLEDRQKPFQKIRLLRALGYLDFLGLMSRAKLVITDSGGIQEETAALQVPCLTLRPNTERPATIEHGMNQLIAPRPEAVRQALNDFVTRPPPKKGPPPLWDGHAAVRVVECLKKWFLASSQAIAAEHARRQNVGTKSV